MRRWPSDMNPHLQKLRDKGSLVRQRMWKHHEHRLPRGEAFVYATMRVVAITFAGIKENHLLNSAAALSFSTLIGLGPLIALTVLISGFVLNQAQPDIAQTTIEDTITFFAPQLSMGGSDGENGSDFSELISRFIEASQSSTVGIGGTLILILIVIQLFTTIEDSFNRIWGVHRGRNLVTRVIIYWSVITLGAVIVFAGLAIIISEAFKPGGIMGAQSEDSVGSWIAQFASRFGSLALTATVLSFFYRFIPNTQVDWKASIIGAVFATVCFLINNTFAFLYIERVALQRTLYGSLGVLPVLMIGLYFFWMFLLLGGRLSFAVQNARFQGGKIAWNELSHASKESLCLLMLCAASRQFRQCREALSSAELAALHGLPRQLASGAMQRLCNLELASALPPKEGDAIDAYRYQPARPLEKIRLIDFRRAFETYGDAPDEDHFDGYDPIVRQYHSMLDKARDVAFGNTTLADLLEQRDDQPSPVISGPH